MNIKNQVGVIHFRVLDRANRVLDGSYNKHCLHHVRRHSHTNLHIDIRTAVLTESPYPSRGNISSMLEIIHSKRST